MIYSHDVFICHASQDKQRIVEPVATELKSQRISYWLDSGAVQWGDDIVQKINLALTKSLYVLAVITPNFSKTIWARREFNSALSLELSSDETRVLPLFAGTDAEIDRLRDEFPLAHSKMFLKWEGDPVRVASELASRVRQTSQLARLAKSENDEYTITTAFWAGRFSESASKSQTILELALRRGDFAVAALSLANLILISRSRNRFRDVVYYMRRYFRDIPMRKVPVEYRLRLIKELFVYYYEREDFTRSAIYLERMERLDPTLMIYTPSDDWIPGTVRWRKAHLNWLTGPSDRQLSNSIALAQEGVAYLQDVLQSNPNSAGLASANLNVGWLYFLEGSPVSLDYFDQAITNAAIWSPRTEIEAQIARAIAEARFGITGWREASYNVPILVRSLRQGGFPVRTYAFLQNYENYSAIKKLLTWSPGDPALRQSVTEPY